MGKRKLKAVEEGVEDGVLAQKEDFIFNGGLRMVRPYNFDFFASVKQRWAGKTLLELFLHEFPGRDAAYYTKAIEEGRLRLTGRSCTPDTRLKESDRIRHLLHRHEPPTLDHPVKVLATTPDLVAVDKPASFVVHPSGQYRKNTVIAVLHAERPDLLPLHPVHRLDKPVSGLLVFARNPAAANEIRELIESSRVEKRYLARVKGEFGAPSQYVGRPGVADAGEGWTSVEVGLAWDPRDHYVHAVPEGTPVPQPIPADGPPLVVKDAKTLFRVVHVASDGSTSLVECRPITGRTHQIRVHLRHLGHPIINDARYGGSLVEGAPEGPAQFRKSAANQEQEMDAARAAIARTEGGEAGPSTMAEALPGLLFRWEGEQDSLCQSCPFVTARGYTEHDLTPLLLHASRYACPDKGWSFDSPQPPWAEASVTLAGLREQWGDRQGAL